MNFVWDRRRIPKSSSGEAGSSGWRMGREGVVSPLGAEEPVPRIGRPREARSWGGGQLVATTDSEEETYIHTNTHLG